MKIRPPKIIRKFFSSLTWNFECKENAKNVFITFDDGPTSDITYWILDTLDRYDAKATFFCLGKNVEQYNQQYQEMVKRGHIVGNHTYSHMRGWSVSTADYLEDIDLANDTIGSNLFRPPYGRITIQQINRVSERYNIIMWDVLSMDYSNLISPKKCLRNVIDNIRGGSIVVFHDSAKSEENMKYVLPLMLEYLKDNGYSCKSIIL